MSIHPSPLKSAVATPSAGPNSAAMPAAAVVLEAAGGCAHAVAAGVEPALVGHVGESERAIPVAAYLKIVAKQAAAQHRAVGRREERVIDRRLPQQPPLHDEDVEIAVVV